MPTIKKTLTAAAIALTTSSALAAQHGGTAGYALTAEGNTLLVMDSLAAPEDVRSVPLSSSVRSIAWRPVTGELIGYADGAIVTIDPVTGMTTDLGATFSDDAVIANDAVVAFDFNNAIDAVRAVSSTGDNLVYFPIGFGDNDERANSVRRFTDLFYAQGDASQGKTPQVFANAYTNAINGMTAEATFQYALDAATDSLISLANNAGTLETVAAITVDGQPVDILPVGGFDIVSKEVGSDAAYAVLQIAGQENAGIYQLDLETGAASLLAPLNTADVSSFAASIDAM